MMSLCRMIVARNTDLFQLCTALKIPTVAVLTGEEMIRWSPGENTNLVHLEIFGGSWPSTGKVLDGIRQVIRQTKKE